MGVFENGWECYWLYLTDSDLLFTNKSIDKRQQFLMATNQQTTSLCHLPPNYQLLEAMELPFPINSQQRSCPLNSLMSQRPQPIFSDRINKSASLRTIGQLKQILSRSLFNNKPPIKSPKQQKPRDALTVVKSDSKPISPESQQKEPFQTDKSSIAYAFGVFEECENEMQFSNTNEMLDSNFNRFLELNLPQDKDIGLDIQSKFITKLSMGSQKADTEVQFMVPSTKLQHVIAHEKLLQEENAYIREQLIAFTETIDGERIKYQEMKQKAKNYSRQNHKLKQKTKILLEELTDRQEKYYSISTMNDQYAVEVGTLRRGNKDLLQKVEELTKECQEVFSRLENYESIKEREIEEKNREKEALQDELAQKDRQIEGLQEYVEILKKQLGKNTCDDRVTCSLDDEQELEEEKGSSICLSLAEAQSLKHIIETKQQMFQQQVQTLKRRSIIVQNESSAKIDELTNKLKATQAALAESEAELLSLRGLLDNESSKNQQLSERLTELQSKVGIDNEQDEQLEDLLENCLEELERERGTTTILREQIANLKRLFAQEMYYVQKIEQHICTN